MSDAEGGSSESQPGNSRQNVGSCRAKSRKDPPESDQTLVNRAILESLKQIQESICNRNENLPYYEDNGSQATYQPSVKSDSDSHVDIESELNELTNIGNTVRSANDEESSDLLFEYDYQLDIPQCPPFLLKHFGGHNHALATISSTKEALESWW